MFCYFAGHSNSHHIRFVLPSREVGNTSIVEQGDIYASCRDSWYLNSGVSADATRRIP